MSEKEKWMFRVRTLGTFDIGWAGQAAKTKSKVQTRPIELLKVAIAFGGRAVGVQKIADAMWPHIDSDYANRSFNTTLHRLRNILGEDQALILEGGRLSLNPSFFWVDIWALEQAMKQVVGMIAGDIAGSHDEIKAVVGKVMDIYQGTFLGDEDVSWAIAKREQVRNRFTRFTNQIVNYFNASDCQDETIDLLERGIETDDKSESLYRLLMLCHAEQGRKAEAIEVYNRCRTMLEGRLGVTPSPETEEIYQQIACVKDESTYGHSARILTTRPDSPAVTLRRRRAFSHGRGKPLVSFFRELRRRRVFRVAALYFVGAWVALQVMDLALESWGLPSTALRYIWIGALIGFPLAMILGWTYNIIDGRIVRTSSTGDENESDLTLRRSDYLLFGATVLVLATITFGVLGRVQSDNSDSVGRDIVVSVSTWPEADTMFRQNPYWLGGDASASVDLGGGRILWLFGDSFVASMPGQSRAEATMVRNSVAIQRGYDPSSAKLQFYWRTDGPSPTSYFKENINSWFWPTSAVLIGRSLLIFLVETEATDEGLGFEHTGMAAIMVDNPQDAPDSWRLREVPIPLNETAILIGYSDTIRVENHVFAFSRQESTNDVYLVRWSLEDLFAGNLEDVEWWSGDNDNWALADEAVEKARPVISATAEPFSVHYHQSLKKFVQLQTWGFGGAVVAMRTATKLTGPWSDRQIIYRPDESRRSDAMVYGGKTHVHLIGADIVATYNVNSSVFSELLANKSIYYPRFIRLAIEP